jgi:hypothetical protein
MKLMRYLSVVLFAALVSNSWAATGEAALMIKADKLREKPFADAAVLTTLAIKQPVTVISRSGA